MKYKQIWKTAAACLMAAVMLPGCSDEVAMQHWPFLFIP